MYPPRTPDDARDPNTQPRTWGGLVLATALVAAVPVALLAAAESPAAVVGLCGVVVVTAATVYAARRRNRGEPTADRDRDDSHPVAADPRATAPDATAPDPHADVPVGRESDPCRTTEHDPVDATSPDARPGAVAGRVCRRSD